MDQPFIRVYKRMDVEEIKRHLLIFGDLSANCANCNAIDIKLDAAKCPGCETEFKYIAFRNIRNHLPKLQKLVDARPELIFIDHDDFKRHLASLKAKEFLK